MQPEQNKKQGRWGSIFVMSFASASDNTEGGLINSLFPVIRAAFGLSLGALGIFTSISRFARMLFGPLWSMAADKWGRKRILVFVTGIWGFWTLLAGLAQNYTQLLILYSIGVIGTVASEPIINGMLADMFAEEERGKAYGAVRSIGAIAAIVVTPLIGQLSKIPDGWRIGMYIMGGISVLSGILIALFVKEPPKTAASEAEKDNIRWRDIPEILSIPTMLLLAVNLLFVTSLVLFSYLVTFMVDVYGMTTASGNIVLAVFALGFGISSLVGGLLGDRFEKKFGYNGRIILMQIYLAVFALMSYLTMQIRWEGAMVYVLWLVFGLIGSFGFSGVVLPMVSNVVRPQVSATAFALLFSLIQGLLSALISLAVGFLAERYGLQTVMLWTITVPYAINAVFWFLFYKVYPGDVARLKAKLAK
jgi:predicted MFS family arabinose efflux permease